MTISMQSIATVHSPFTKGGVRMSRRDIIAQIVVREDLAAALTGIEDWSHLIVLFWMDQLAGNPHRLTTHPRRRADLPELGVFCARGRERPNPIGLAVVELLLRLHLSGTAYQVCRTGQSKQQFRFLRLETKVATPRLRVGIQELK